MARNNWKHGRKWVLENYDCKDIKRLNEDSLSFFCEITLLNGEKRKAILYKPNEIFSSKEWDMEIADKELR